MKLCISAAAAVVLFSTGAAAEQPGFSTYAAVEHPSEKFASRPVCDGQHPNYCDCGDDCVNANHPEWCACAAARECCAGAVPFHSAFDVFPVDDVAGCNVPTTKATAMKARGFTKVACPFGVLVAGTEGFDDLRLKLGANVIASILDQDADGVADDPDVVEALTYRGKVRGGALLQCGVSEEEERRGDALGDDVFDYAFSCQTWKAYDVADVAGIMMEEAFHLIHQLGYAQVYPDQFGMEDFTSSVVGREMARLQCVQPGWFHPENSCPEDAPRQPANPASSPLRGTCNDPNCDISEFYKMVLFLAIGMGEDNDPGGPSVWVSAYMPGKQEEVLAMLSTEFKDMINTASFHQLSAPLTGEYEISTKDPVDEPPTTPDTLPDPLSPIPDAEVEEPDSGASPGVEATITVIAAAIVRLFA